MRVPLLSLLILICALRALPAAVPQDFAVDLRATVSDTVPRIVLSWSQREQGSIASQKIHRRLKGETAWVELAALSNNQTTYTDNTALAGVEYEYWMERRFAGLSPNVAVGYLSAGVKVPEVHDRGVLLLVVDNTMLTPLATEIAQLKADLAADGWRVQQINAPRTGTAISTKALIAAAYNADPANVKLVYVLGHVPVPYSGSMAPDGHSNHVGAWSADGYYGEMDGTWTDTSVNNTSAARVENHNVPGDGKFDQSQFLSLVELGVGRVDMHGLGRAPSAATPEMEVSLLRRYLQKAHEFRHKKQRYAAIPRRTLIRDSFNHAFSSEPFAVLGWAVAYSSVGHPPSSPIDAAPAWQWFAPAYAGGQNYLWGYACGGGSYESASGFGTSTDLGRKPSRVVFGNVFGSYHGDWDSNNNIMRAMLAGNPDGDSLGLSCFWSGRPHWFAHHLGMGETLGYMTRVSMNAAQPGGGGYVPGGSSFRGVHIGLMGDPALRLHQVEPPRRLAARSLSGQVELNWAASTETGLQGYHVYRANAPEGPFAKLTSSPQAGTTYTDTGVTPENSYTYLVRTLKLDTVPGGSYYNLSVGSTVSITASAPPTAQPRSPSDLLLVSQTSATSAQISWQDNATDETGYRVERKVNTGPWTTRATLGANAASYTDTGSFSHLGTYAYRVVAFNAEGDSPASNVVSFEASAGFIELTERIFIAAKSAGSIAVTVRRFGGSTGGVNVNFATSNSSALASTHYTNTSGVLTWADGESGEKTINVPIVNNATPWQARQFYVTLTSPTNGARLGVFTRTSVLIEDPAAALAPPWQQAFLGSAPSYPYGTAEHASPAVSAEGIIGSTVMGGSLASGGSSDNGRFIHQQRTGDGSMTAFIRTPSPNTGSARMALMIRESLAANARMAGVAASSQATPAGYGTKLVYRTTTTLAETPSASNQFATPCWVRLTRTGLSFKAEHSTDGNTWTLVGQTTLSSMPDTAYWGLFTIGAGVASTTDYNGNFHLCGFENVSFADLPLPATPAGFNVTAVSSTNVSLSWTQPEFASGYRIERRGDDGSVDIIATIINPATITYNDATVRADTAYEYRIQAHNGTGASDWSAPVRVVTGPPDVTATITTAAPGGADAAIRFNSPGASLGTEESLPVTSTEPFNGMSTVAKSWLRFDLGDLPPLKTAQLKLAKAGEENLSGINLYRMQARLLQESSDIWDESAITWENAPQNDTASTGTTGTAPVLVDFTYRDNVLLPGKDDEEAPGDDSIFTFDLNTTTLNNGRGPNNLLTIALVPVSANSGGIVWAAREHPTLPPPTLEVTMESAALRRPGFLTVTPGDGEPILSWLDATPNETGFQIERRAPGGEWILIATTGPDAASFTDTDAQPGVIYEYRIRAVNASGSSSWATLASIVSTTSASVTHAVSSPGGSVFDLTDLPGGNAYVPPGLMHYSELVSFASSVTLTTTAPRNNANTWRGMQITVGEQPLVVHELARWVLSGNTGPHTVKIVRKISDQGGEDVPGGSVVVNTAGEPVGFKYVKLASPVTLTANTVYWIVCQEFSGGDTWYPGNNVVIHNPVIARVDQAVFSSNGTVYSLDNGPGNTYIPLDFKHTSIERPLINGHGMNALRNDRSGWFGMEITTGASSLIVTRLGRWVAPGNSEVHPVKLVEALTGATLGSVNVATVGTDPGQFAYAPLPGSITLSPQSRYYLLSQETAGGDAWYAPDWSNPDGPIAGMILSDLRQIPDGTPKPATVTTTPPGLNVTVTYDGSPTPPSAPGSYAVVATIQDAHYQGTASGTLVLDHRADREVAVPEMDAPLPATEDVTAWDAGLLGMYDGLLHDADDKLAGALEAVKLSALKGGAPGAAVSGTLRIKGQALKLRGSFSAAGEFTQTATLPGLGGTVVIDLKLQRTTPGGHEVMTGTVDWNGGELVASVYAPRAAYSNAVNAPAENQGRFTVLLPSEYGWGTTEPGGDGWGMVSVDKAGVAKLAGRLGDGTAVTETGYLSGEDEVCFHRELYKTKPEKGRIGGRVVFRDEPGISDFAGRMQWVKLEDTREKQYADGFDVEVTLLGSRFEPKAKGQRLLNELEDAEPNAVASLIGLAPEGYSTGQRVERVLNWLANNKLTHYGPQKLSGTASNTTGQVTGSFADKATGMTVKFAGMVFQKQGLAAGVFMHGPFSGALRIMPGTHFPYPGSEDAGSPALAEAPADEAGPPQLIDQRMEWFAVGTYTGVFADAGGVAGGLENVKVTVSGAFSGVLWLDGVKHAIRGQLDGISTPATATIEVAGLTVTLVLKKEDAPASGYQLTGIVADGEQTYTLAAQQLPNYSGAQSAPQEGSYTVALPAPETVNPADEPGGDGYGTLKVSKKGVCAGALVLAEGTKTTFAGHVTAAGEWSFYRTLYGGNPARGYLGGKLTFRDVPGVSDVDGSWRWVKHDTAVTKPAVYTSGFDVTRKVTGAKYAPPGKGARAWPGLADGWHNVWSRWSGPSLSATVALPELNRVVTWTATNQIMYYGPDKLTVKVNVKTGLVTGSYKNPTQGANQNFGGVLLQKQGMVTGSYVNANGSGRFWMQAR